MVDAGFSPRELARRFAVAQIAPESIEAVIVTHEHGDHVKGACGGSDRWGWSVHATAGTVAAAPELATCDVRTFDAGDTLVFDSMRVLTVPVPHDASDPVGIVATDVPSGARVGVLTDLGEPTLGVRGALRDLDVLVLESNHDDVMLERGPYPVAVRRRIASRTGHLSNRSAAVLARACAHAGLQHLVLAHLSEKCNTPDHALAAVSAALVNSRFRGQVSAAAQDVVRGAFVSSSRSARTTQLSLGL
jgi:phosphoribosyl 1,2-cyclic phosphodiesterase